MDTFIPRKPVRTLAEVQQIVSITDPVLRNLRITHCYHELSASLAERLGSGANWCTFATWASKQAGQTIRREDLADMLEGKLHVANEMLAALQLVTNAALRIGSKLTEAARHKAVWTSLIFSSTLERASVAVARGNKGIFEDIGHEFARFCATCLSDGVYNKETIEAFNNTLRDGDPPDGQVYLRRAFRRYYEAFFESDPQVRAELMFLANIEIGVHEQTKFQPEVTDALNAALPDPAEIKKRLMPLLFPEQGIIGRLWSMVTGLFGKQKVLDDALERLVEAARSELRFLMTEHMMTLDLPDGTRLRLGSNLTAQFPPMLTSLTNAELIDLLARMDPTLNSTSESGASDWANLNERLHYIIDMFRCYHESSSLHNAPFTADQINDLLAGRRPPQPL